MNNKCVNDKWVERWDVTGTSGKPYVVARDLNNNFGCSCPAWRLHKGNRTDCQHILRIKLELAVPASAVNQKQIREIQKNPFPIRQIYLED